MKQLQDNDAMPFGQHQGLPMIDVPASYLFWLWSECGLEDQVNTSPVADYINRNLAGLEDQYPDGEWR